MAAAGAKPSVSQRRTSEGTETGGRIGLGVQGSTIPAALRPVQEFLLGPVVDDARLRDSCEPGVRDGDVDEVELGMRMRVAVEREQAAVLERARRQLVMDVLSIPRSVDLDRHLPLRGNLEHAIPVGADTRPDVEPPPLRMAENTDARLR